MAKAKTTVWYRVKMEVPEGATLRDVQVYISQAVASTCGGLDPIDPMFELNRDSITVSLLKKEVTYG